VLAVQTQTVFIRFINVAALSVFAPEKDSTINLVSRAVLELSLATTK
jgi:hypothetical protein